LKSSLEKRKFIALNNTLQGLLNEQLDLDLLLNYKMTWKEGDKLKSWLDFKYANREFDISKEWKKKVEMERVKKETNDPDFNEQIIIDNEIKKTIYFKLVKRSNELPRLILNIIDEIKGITDKDNVNNLSDTQLDLIFK